MATNNFVAEVTFKGSPIFPTSSYILDIPTAHSKNIMLGKIIQKGYATFLQKRNTMNLTWKCHLKVFPTQNSYDICSQTIVNFQVETAIMYAQQFEHINF